MKRVMILAIALSTTSCGEPKAPSGEVASGMPPARFRGAAEFQLKASADVGLDCKKAGLKPVDGTKTEACAVIGGPVPVVIISNPCKSPGHYARTLCHELGHVNGWPATHGE